MCGKPDSPSSLDFLAIFIESIADDCLGPILIRCDRLWRKRVVGGIVELFIIGPIWAAGRCQNGVLSTPMRGENSKDNGGNIEDLLCDFGHLLMGLAGF